MRRITLEEAVRMTYGCFDRSIRLKTGYVDKESRIRPSKNSHLFFKDDKRLREYIKKHVKIEEIITAEFKP